MEDIWVQVEESNDNGEDCIMRSFMVSTPHQILLG